MASSEENFEKIMEEVEKEEKVSPSESTASTTVEKVSDEISFPHEKIMEEEGLTKNDLPDDVRKMVVTFERKLRMAKAKKASEETMRKIQNLSTLIADKIIDHLESDLPENEQMEDGGSFDEGGIGDIDDGIDGVDDPLDDEPEIKEKGGIFGGVLGGILDW